MKSLEIITNIEHLTATEVNIRVLDVLERFGPLCLIQIFTHGDMTPEQAQASVDNLWGRGLIEICPDEGLKGPRDLTVTYGLPTGKGRIAYKD